VSARWPEEEEAGREGVVAGGHGPGRASRLGVGDHCGQTRAGGTRRGRSGSARHQARGGATCAGSETCVRAGGGGAHTCFGLDKMAFFRRCLSSRHKMMAFFQLAHPCQRKLVFFPRFFLKPSEIILVNEKGQFSL
jgi:hypothetical protein